MMAADHEPVTRFRAEDGSARGHGRSRLARPQEYSPWNTSAYSS
jgi:hypothetical protein